VRIRIKYILVTIVVLIILVGGVQAFCSKQAVSAHQQSATGMNYQPMLLGTTGSIGGGALLAGGCTTGTVSVAGAQPGMPVVVTASDGTNIPGLGTDISGTVTSTGTVTVTVCALLALTPGAKTYSVRVLQ
jgi:hypothetical protein